MSSTLYNKAFEVELMHNFYVYPDAALNNAFKVNRDMRIVPTRECYELMKGGRMRFVPTMKGFTTFYQAYINPSNAQEPLVKLNDDSEFVFSLHMDVSAIDLFLNVSDLNVGSKTYSSGKFFMLEQKVETSTANPPQTLSLTATLANSLRSAVFTYAFKRSTAFTGNADIEVRSGSITGPVVQTITGVPRNIITDTYSAEINLSQQPKGFYVLRAFETGTSTVINSNDFYVDGDLAAQNTFGILKVIYEDIDKLYLTTTGSTKYYTFNYTFAVRSVKWRYYLVVENLDALFFNNNSLQIKDESGGGVVFNASEPPPVFTQPLGKPDPVIAVNGLRTVIFDSQSVIPFSEKPMKGINLYRQPADEKMISNLPNANPVGVDSDQYNPAQTPPLAPAANISEIYVYI